MREGTGISRRRGASRTGVVVMTVFLAACGGGGATTEPSDAREPDVVPLDAADVGGATCTIAADCPQEACKLAACVAGRCTTADRPDGTACDDGLDCTTGDTCHSGACVPEASTCAPACAVDVDCPPIDAADLCQGRPSCVAGACRPDLARVVTCAAAGAPCRVAACEPASGLCVDVPVADGAACDDDDPCSVTSCVAGACVESAASPCECRVDADCELFDQPCGVRHACATEVFPHVCQEVPGSAPVCDDPDPHDCLERACEPLSGACVDEPAADGSACDDGDPCTQTACTAGACVPSAPSVCECQVDADCPDDDDACNGHPVCDRSGWPPACSIDPESVPAPCDASADTVCRHAVCDPATGACGVVPRASGQACVPDSPCVVGATCQQGACEGSARDCDDQSPCTDDACHPLTGECAHAPVQGTVYCEDPAPCNVGGQCVGGLCLGSLRFCDDQNPCTTEACDKTSGLCVTTPLSDLPCNDTLACTQGDVCDDGVCRGVLLACDDGNPCTADACDEATGACAFTPTVGAPCDDGTACTQGDACDAAGACTPASTTVCKSKGTCWHEACNPAPGNGRCEMAADPDQEGDPCSPYEPCAVQGHCQGATCEPTLWRSTCCESATDCDDDDACTVDDCVAHACRHDAVVCDAGELGCTFTPCLAGACAAPVVLGGRRVLLDRAPAPPAWGQGSYESIVGAFDVDTESVRLSGLVPGAGLMLPPVRVPRGASTLRLRVLQPAEAPATLGLVVSDAAVFASPQLTVRTLDLDDVPGFDVLVDLSSSFDRTRTMSLVVTDPTLALGRVQVVHHGGEGCPGSVEAPGGLPYQDTVVYATGCVRPDGSLLAAWLEAKAGTEGTVAWAVRDAFGAWGERWTWDETIGGAGSSFRIACTATGTGWALAFGSYLLDGEPAAMLVGLQLSGGMGPWRALVDAVGATVGYPALTRSADGGFLLAYARKGAPDADWDVFVRRFDELANPLGPAVLANGSVQGDQRAPTLAVSGDRVLVAWEEALSTDPVHLKRALFSSDLTSLVPESMFAGSADAAYRFPSAVALPSADGARFLVVYQAGGKPAEVDPGLGVYRSEIDGAGVEVVNEVGLADVTAGDQMVPFASVVPGGAAVVWASNDTGTVDLVLARVDGAGVHPGVRLVPGVQGFGAVVSNWPGALEAIYWRADGPGFARLGLACDAGPYDCSTATPRVCIDADAYLPATSACSGEGCTPVCP